MSDPTATPDGESNSQSAKAPAVEGETKQKPPVYLLTSGSAEICERPGSAKATFKLDTDAIRDIERSNYLILGFDTEYQSLQEFSSPADVRAKKAKYEVLSYQFFAINDTGEEWSGIAIPDHGKRISLSDFVIFALTKGVEKGITVPKTIVLVGHYNRADVPAFDDRDQLWWRLNNVRNSLVSLGMPIPIRFSQDHEAEEATKLNIYVRDTMLLAPTGKRSLAQLGSLIGIEKIKLAEDRDDELLLKKTMKNVRALQWDLFEQYALIDAEISAKYFQRVTAKFQEATGSSFIPTALSNIGMNLLLQDWASRGADVLDMTGKELVTELIYNEKIGGFITRKHKPYVEESSWFTSFATETYHGGRNEQLWFGPSFEDDWVDYDLSSAYPTAMAIIGKPDWTAMAPCTDLEALISHDVFGFACVDFEFPKTVRYPTLPVRTQHGIVFPYKGRSYCSTPELEVAHNLGCKLDLKFAVKAPQSQETLVFFPFIRDSVRQRENAMTAIDKAFWKEITNSCYGKTAQGLQDKRVFNLKEKSSERVEPSTITNPFYASYITSFVRAVVGELMNAIPPNKMIFSVTTDGFITNATGAEMESAKAGPLTQRFSKARFDLTGDGSVLAEKHIVRQLIGWRTRGQATLKEGLGENPVVLARAGIKPPIWADEDHERNEFIVSTFFERTPETEIEFDVHTSVREMTLYDADLVSKKLIRRTSMEYDFKRRPQAIAEIEVDWPSVPEVMRRHVAFSTVPWNTVDEFLAVRKMREDRWKRRCIKTAADFADFAEVFDMLYSLNVQARKYLRGDEKSAAVGRLRMDLCTAYHLGRAGFPKPVAMSAADFADVLNDSGFKALGQEVSRADVENGRRRKWKGNATPPTKEVMALIGAIESHFPTFQRSEVLAVPVTGRLRMSAALPGDQPMPSATSSHQ